ncbi:MAG: MFS transporter [Pirellulales bacterium]
MLPNYARLVDLNTNSQFTVPGFLTRLGLHRPELRAWALYDWANSAVVTTVIAAVFPIYFYRVAGANLPEGAATQRFAIATLVAMAMLALVAPVLGVLADSIAVKKKLLGLFLSIGAPATGAMFFIYTGDWLFALVLFAIVELSVAGTFVFYDSLLPHIARHDEIDRVSTTGYAIGYLGGGVLLALNLAWIQFPQWFGLPHGTDLTDAQATLPSRLAFLSVALWWVVFSLPLFVKIPEPPVEPAVGIRGFWPSLGESFAQALATVNALRQYRQAGVMLLAFLIYNEGIGTIIKMAAIYGAEIGLRTNAMIGSILLVQFIGIPCTILFGAMAGKLDTKPSIFIGLTVYLGIALLGYVMRSEAQFLTLAILIGMVQGGTQALSRSLFASLIPKQKSTQFFALFALSEKLAGILGPGLFVLVIELTDSSRNAIVSVVVFFLVGGLLLSQVDVTQGRAAVVRKEEQIKDKAPFGEFR